MALTFYESMTLEGFAPPTFAFEARCCYLLSYRAR